MTFDLPSGKKRQKVTVTVKDQAGNETTTEIVTAPAWMRTGSIMEGELYLEDDYEYNFPSGTTWTADGQATTFMGGNTFYAEEGTYNFHKH